MPPRLNKRLAREQEELADLEGMQDLNFPQGDDSSEEHPPSYTTSGTGFASLRVTGDNETQTSDEEQQVGSSRAQKKKKKKKKKRCADTTVPSSLAIQEPTEMSMKRVSYGAASKKKKIGNKQKTKTQNNTTDDLDQVLAELSSKYSSLQTRASAHISRSLDTFHSLLAVSVPHLDSETEMRKFFGSKVISASKTSPPGPSAASSRRHPVAVRSNLTRPQPTWWPPTLRQGLSIRPLTDLELQSMMKRHQWISSPGDKVWTIEYSRKYRGITKSFMQMVMSGDPEGFWTILRDFPYHADTLLQVSEIYYHREEHSTAADFINRALFTYERAFVGAFNFTTGINRLEFDRVENRPFFLAIHRQVIDLQRRGCFRTAFEYARLLYSLDPSVDPHGALLHLDFLAIKTGMTKWLLDLWENQGEFIEDSWRNRLNIRALPGWAYARALALFIEECSGDKTHEKSTFALTGAIQAFPSVLPLLANKSGVFLPEEVRIHPSFHIHADARTLPRQSDAVLHLLSHLYAQRSASLWKVESRSAWLADTTQSMLSPSQLTPLGENGRSVDLFHALFGSSVLSFSIYRHVIVMESTCRSLFPFLPSSVVDGKQFACDPLPPPTRVSEYNTEFFRGAEDPFIVTPRGREETERILERLLPDPIFRRQLQTFFQAHPRFAQRFPGGIVQFAQIAGQLPEEMLEDLMIGELAGHDGHEEGGAMPGQMPPEVPLLDDIIAAANHGEPHEPRAEETLEDEERDVDEEEPAVSSFPIRVMRNIFNRFWGGTNTPIDSSNDELQGPSESDDDGVD